MVRIFLKTSHKGEKSKINIPEDFKGAKYVIYFNPIIFLNLNIKQMESTIKHEILHILSMHLIRAKEFKGRYSQLAINMAMDIVVNKYLNNLPPYATTLEWVNLNYSLKLEPYEALEYYVEKIQTAIDLLEEDEDAVEDYSDKDENIEADYSPEKTHNIWEDSSEIDEMTLKNSNGELPWNLYLNRLMGAVESNKKKTITRRNRRQPDRLDLRGVLRSHKAKIVVALDISGSISDEEFKQAIKLLVYFTDGKGEDELIAVPKGYKILWVISGREDKLSLKEPYGAVKKLSNIEIKDITLDMSDIIRDGYSMNNQERIL